MTKIIIKSDREKIIQEKLQKAFSPQFLNIIDDSDQHIGHAGSRDGAGHYTVEIAAHCFAGKSRVAIHREIYEALSGMIPAEIHALKIKLHT